VCLIAANVVVVTLGIAVCVWHWGWPGWTLAGESLLSCLVFANLRIRGQPGARHRRIRNGLSASLRWSLIAFAVSTVFALLDAWGQSLYALVSYAGSFKQAWAGIAGVTGVASLAPFVRRLAERGTQAGSSFKLPARILALLYSVLVAFGLLVAISFIAQGFAWNWGCPAPGFSNRTNPAANLYDQYFKHPAVGLTANRLVRVELGQGTPKPWRSEAHGMDTQALWAYFVASLLLCGFFGQTITFLNLSSFHELYTARLVRAYLGAANPYRWGPGASIKRVHAADDLAWSDYRPHEHGGPLHLVNIALNSTVSLETDAEFNTAKSLNFCVGPAGLSFGLHHALGSDPSDSNPHPCPAGDLVWLATPSNQVEVRAIEPLRVGDWIGISGAAFTTGLGNVGGGSGTSLGTSLLCGLFNVRLGYWWQNDLSRPAGHYRDWAFPVQSYLLCEFTGRFDIQHYNRWYLSDGGHFENTAAYELIRRHIPFIIVADCGADKDGHFDDIGTLTRRVRIDFGAEITFLDDQDLVWTVAEEYLAPCVVWRSKSTRERPPEEPTAIAGRIGTLEDMRPFLDASGRRRVRAHATLAHVEYANSPGAKSSLILFIKPGITADLPADLLVYQQAQQDFPQQSTLDQFFDEAQWESYRKLGECLSTRIFKVHRKNDGKWSPGIMKCT
jgi:hypothetical protein